MSTQEYIPVYEEDFDIDEYLNGLVYEDATDLDSGTGKYLGVTHKKFGSPPAARKCVATSARPSRTASRSGVPPHRSWALMSAPRSTSSLTIGRLPTELAR